MMDTPPIASSLYGPGTFICWLCSLASVLISWSFNHHSKTHDTISNDLLASLALPGIAGVHFVYTFFNSGWDSGEHITQSAVTMEATSSVCVWFLGVGSLLMSLAVLNRNKNRLICTISVQALCLPVLVLIHITTVADVSLRNQIAKLAFTEITLCPAIVIPLAMRAALHDKNWKWISWHRNQRFCFEILMFTTCWVVTFVFLLHSSSNYSAIYPDVVYARDRSWFERLILPRSGIAITELDQIVAIVVGVLTVLVTIKEAITSRNITPWDRYKVWRAKCEALLKEGVLTGDEASQLKDRLESLAQREKDILDAPGSTNVLERMEHIQEKRGLERIAELRHQALPTYSSSIMWDKII